MEHRTRLVISTAAIGTGFAVIGFVIAYQLGYSVEPVILGWIFGVSATGMSVACDNYLSRQTTTGGK